MAAYDATTVSEGLPQNKPRVVLADDQAANMALLESLLSSDFEVVATVQDGLALVDAVTRLTPDAVVTDISMPVLDGIAAAREILRRNPTARVISSQCTTTRRWCGGEWPSAAWATCPRCLPAMNWCRPCGPRSEVNGGAYATRSSFATAVVW